MAIRQYKEQQIVDAFKTIAEFMAEALIDSVRATKPATPPQVLPVDQLVYNRKQAAMALGVSVSTLRRIVDAGDLKPIMLTCKAPKYDPDEIKAYLKKMRAKSC